MNGKNNEMILLKFDEEMKLCNFFLRKESEEKVIFVCYIQKEGFGWTKDHK